MKHILASGMTLIEMTIVAVVIVTIMLAVASTGGVVGRTVAEIESNADLAEDLRTVSERIGKLLRPASLASLETRATAADIAEAMANSQPVPTLGDWITPSSINKRRSLQFRASSGQLTMNAADLTSVRSLEFILDPNETENDIDDDGDGLIDEGSVYLVFEGVRSRLARDIEDCNFTVTGKVFELNLQCARERKEKGVLREAIQEQFLIRNQ